MKSLNHLFRHIRTYGLKHNSLYTLAMMAMFLCIFDGIICYIAPLIITESGFSKTMMGIIIGSSSIAGALFDLIMYKLFPNTNFRRVFLIMFLICLVQPFILYFSKTLWIYLVAMMTWGIYFDLSNYGNQNFVAHLVKKEEHASSFGVINVFQWLGYAIAPLAVGLTLGAVVGWQSFILAWVFLSLSFLFYIILIFMTKKTTNIVEEIDDKNSVKRGLLQEFRIWKLVGVKTLPVLILIIFLWMLDAFFWNIGPLYAQSFKSLGQFEGIFLTAYSLPPLLIGWFIGPITKKFGKKRSAFYSFLIGCALLLSFAIVNSPLVIIAITFIASCFIAVSFPSINGACANYISESPEIEKEIETTEDFSLNIGYLLGPILAGILADGFGNANAFAIFGVIGIIVSLILIKLTPKNINLNTDKILGNN